MKEQSGFTLLELLVVIAIIGLLSTILMASVTTARDRANDAAKLQSLRSVQVAIEEYYNDNGDYPIIPSERGPQWVSIDSTCDSWRVTLTNLLNPYITSLPQGIGKPFIPLGSTFQSQMCGVPMERPWPYVYTYNNHGPNQPYTLFCDFTKHIAYMSSYSGYVISTFTYDWKPIFVYGGDVRPVPNQFGC